MVLFVDACARQKSRTRELAEAVCSNIACSNDDVEFLKLYDLNLSPLTEQILKKRDEALFNKDFSDSYFDLAKQFAEADFIIIAAPYWDLSFPAVLKLYIENISVNGITFEYDETGVPNGLCKAEKLYYVTTAGGEIGNYNFGYDYIKAISLGLFGIKDATCMRAVGLDIDTVDEKEVLENAKLQLQNMFLDS